MAKYIFAPWYEAGFKVIWVKLVNWNKNRPVDCYIFRSKDWVILVGVSLTATLLNSYVITWLLFRNYFSKKLHWMKTILFYESNYKLHCTGLWTISYGDQRPDLVTIFFVDISHQHRFQSIEFKMGELKSHHRLWSIAITNSNISIPISTLVKCWNVPSFVKL